MGLFSDRRKSALPEAYTGVNRPPTSSDMPNGAAVAAASTIGRLFQGDSGLLVRMSPTLVLVLRSNSLSARLSLNYNDQLGTILAAADSQVPSRRASITSTKLRPLRLRASAPHLAPQAQKKPSHTRKTVLASLTPKKESNGTPRMVKRTVPTAHGLQTIEVPEQEMQQVISRASLLMSASQRYVPKRAKRSLLAPPSRSQKRVSFSEESPSSSIAEEPYFSSPLAGRGKEQGKYVYSGGEYFVEESVEIVETSPSRVGVMEAKVIEPVTDEDLSALSGKYAGDKQKPLSKSDSEKTITLSESENKSSQKFETTASAPEDDHESEIVKPEEEAEKVSNIVTEDQTETQANNKSEAKAESNGEVKISNEDRSKSNVSVKLPDPIDEDATGIASEEPIEIPSVKVSEPFTASTDPVHSTSSDKPLQPPPVIHAPSATKSSDSDSLPPLSNITPETSASIQTPTTPKSKQKHSYAGLLKGSENGLDTKSPQKKHVALQTPKSMENATPTLHSKKVKQPANLKKSASARLATENKPRGLGLAKSPSVRNVERSNIRTSNGSTPRRTLRDKPDQNSTPVRRLSMRQNSQTPASNALPNLAAKSRPVSMMAQKLALKKNGNAQKSNRFSLPPELAPKSSFEKLRPTENNLAFKRLSMRDSSAPSTESSPVTSPGSSKNFGIFKSRFDDSDDEDDSAVSGRGFARHSLRPGEGPTLRKVSEAPSNLSQETNPGKIRKFGFAKNHTSETPMLVNKSAVPDILTASSPSHKRGAAGVEEPDALKTPSSSINSDKLFEKHLKESKKHFLLSQFEHSYSAHHQSKKEKKTNGSGEEKPKKKGRLRKLFGM